jgi:hypothetical protein
MLCILVKKRNNNIKSVYYYLILNCSSTGSNRGPSAHKTDALTN